MAKQYSLEDQLVRISELVPEFVLPKAPIQMEDEELFAIEREAMKYAKWVKDERYVQYVPVLKSTGEKVLPR